MQIKSQNFSETRIYEHPLLPIRSIQSHVYQIKAAKGQNTLTSRTAEVSSAYTGARKIEIEQHRPSIIVS